MSQTGPTPSWNVVSGHKDAPWHEACLLSSRNRMTVPVQVRSKVEWLGGGEPVLVLAVCRESGCAEIVQFEEASKLIDENIENLLTAAAGGDSAAREKLVRIQRRYFRLKIDPDGRVILPATLVDKIDPSAGKEVILYVTAYEKTFYVSSRKFELSEDHKWPFDFDGLP